MRFFNDEKNTIGAFSAVAISLGLTFAPLGEASANEVNLAPPAASVSKTDSVDLDYFNVIQKADPYIEKVGLSYSITKPAELKKILGPSAFGAVQSRLEKANLELRQAASREAVKNVHVAILRANGNTVESFWWGKRIKTYGRANAINTRKLASTFSSNAGTAGVAAGLVAAGISFVPGFGAPATVAGALVGVVSWADSATWGKVSDGIANKIDRYRYNLTIDVNAWNMDVKVNDSK